VFYPCYVGWVIAPLGRLAIHFHHFVLGLDLANERLESDFVLYSTGSVVSETHEARPNTGDNR
jgi:hypothetical protein